MRLGQILLESKLITAKQLAYALEYASGKNLFLGRALVLIRYMAEDDLARALQSQDLINMEMSSTVVLEALQKAVKEKCSLEAALKKRHPDLASAPEKKTELIDPLTSRVDNSPTGLVGVGDALLLQDRCREAEAQFKQAFWLLEQSVGSNHIDLAPVLVRLGNTYLALKSFEQARSCYERVLLLKTKYRPDDHLEIAQTFESLADLYTAEQDDSRAMWAYLSALDLLEKKLPGQLVSYAKMLRKLTSSVEHPQSGMKVPVGEILKGAGLLSGPHLDTALRMSKRAALPLGVVLRENGMVGDREFQSALKAQFCIKQGLLSEQLAVNLLVRACRRGVTLDRLLHEAGTLVSTEGTLETYREIAAELDQLVAAESSEISSRQLVAPIASRLGRLYENAGDKTQAELYYSRAIANSDADLEGNLPLAETCSSLAALLQSENRFEEAARLLQTAFEHRRQALGDNDERTIQTLEDIAATELSLGHADEALNLLQEVLTSRENLEHDGVQLLRSVVLSGDCMLDLKNYEGAAATYNAAIGLAKTGDGQPTTNLAIVMEKLGDVYTRQDLLKVAVPLYQQALSIMETVDKTDKRIEGLQTKVANLQHAGGQSS